MRTPLPQRPPQTTNGSTAPATRQRRTLVAAAGLGLGALLLVGCSFGPGGDELYVAGVPEAPSDPEATAPPTVQLWAVEPGDELDDDALLTGDAAFPLDIATRNEYGQLWVNSFGRAWKGEQLISFGALSDSGQQQGVVAAAEPGGDLVELVRSGQADTTVLRRGAFVRGGEGCALATGTDAGDVAEVGEGSCAISTDERWVASWSPPNPGIAIRDLRDDSVERIEGLEVVNAVALAADARVMAIAVEGDGLVGVLIDAATGEEISRTERYGRLDVAPATTGAEAFVLQAQLPAGPEGPGEIALLNVDTDGEVTTIDEGPLLLPVLNDGEVTYLRYGAELTDSSLLRWAPGEEPELLLAGYVGAGSPDGHHVIATREGPDGIEFFTENHGTGRMEQVLDFDFAPGTGSPLTGEGPGIRISRVWTLGHTAFLQVDEQSVSSLVRLDLTGDDSDVPARQLPGLRLDSLDENGMALLTRVVESPGAGIEGTQPSPGRTDVAVVALHDDDPDIRATLGATAVNLIHEGTVYITDATDPEALAVLSVPASGSERELEELYAGAQLAGASWPQQGGATISTLITPGLLRDQQAQQQQAAAGGGIPQP